MLDWYLPSYKLAEPEVAGGSWDDRQAALPSPRISAPASVSEDPYRYTWRFRDHM